MWCYHPQHSVFFYLKTENLCDCSFSQLLSLKILSVQRRKAAPHKPPACPSARPCRSPDSHPGTQAMPGPGSPASPGKCKYTVKKNKNKNCTTNSTVQGLLGNGIGRCCEEAVRGLASKQPAGLRDQEAHAGWPCLLPSAHTWHWTSCATQWSLCPPALGLLLH